MHSIRRFFTPSGRRPVWRGLGILLLVLTGFAPLTPVSIDDALAYTCNVYAYPPSDQGTYAYANGNANCPSATEYKQLRVCLHKQGYGIVSCAYDPGYQIYYFAAVSNCVGSGYYYMSAFLTGQPQVVSYTRFITC